MPKEVLLGVIQKELFPRLFLIIPAYFLSWLVFVQLGFQLTGVKVKFHKIVPGAILGGIYSLYARPYLPELVFSLLIVVMFAIILKVTGRLVMISAILASVYVYLFVLAGKLVFIKPLFEGNRHLGFSNKGGSDGGLGIISEAVFPALVLYICSVFKISMIPSFKKNLSASFFLAKRNEQEKLRFEQEKISLQMEQSHRLIETIFSERREFRNRLQVMNMFAALGKNGELSSYIQSIATQMNETKTFVIENPIIVAAIMSRRILGKEKGIETVVYSNTTLNDFGIDLIKLSETLNVILGLFIENEVLSRSITQTIFMDVKDDGQYYRFQFDNSEEAAANFRSGKYRNYKLPSVLENREEGRKKFKIAVELINELAGETNFIVKGGYVVQLRFKLKKKKNGSSDDTGCGGYPPELTYGS